MLSTVHDLDAYVATRSSWHTLAERVLAPARHHATGRIGLRPTPGGFGTPPFTDPSAPGRTLSVVGNELVNTTDRTSVRHTVVNLGDAAAFAGVDPTAETGVYAPTTSGETATTLLIDPLAATALANWFEFGQLVLTGWSGTHPATAPSPLQLWPEHFDLALDLGPDTGRANYGASPGDASHPLPYLYVGPWVATDDPFWQGGTYAALEYHEILSASDPATCALDFFARGFAVATRK